MSGHFIPQNPPPAAKPPTAAPADAGVQIYFGQATETGCRVYAVWGTSEASAVDPQAFLSGPESPYASTLRARYPLGRRPGAADKPAEAWIAEPCFWTPAAPYVYRYELRFPPPALPVTGMLGIRRLAAQGDHLVFDRKHWVLRGAIAEPPGEIAPGELALGRYTADAGADTRPTAEQAFPLAAWHEAPLAAVVDNPTDQLCDLASRLGVLLVARLSGGGDVAAELRRLARWPAVGIAILTAPRSEDDSRRDDLRRHARNMLLAQSVSADTALEPAAWAQLLFCEVADSADFARMVAGCRLPIVALRPDGDWLSPAEARGACDRLQRDLAAADLQVAGYLV